MKHLITLTFLSIFGLTHAQIPSFIPSTGLVGWWPFNGNANDESGNGNIGTVNGAALTADRNGFANSAYSFDGVDDFIQSNSQSLTGSVSFSVWYKMSTYNINSLGANDYVFIANHSGLSNTAPNVLVGFRNFGSEYGHTTYLFDDNQNLYGHYPTNQIPPANTWHHLVSVFENGQFIKMFLDGDLFYTNTNVPLNSSISSLPIFFGVGVAQQFNFYSGSLDDIGIWNRALTEAEILALYEGCQLAITTQPQDQSVATSVGTASFAAASSSTNATYQWQTNLGLGYQNISNAGQYTGATSAALTVSNLSLSNNNQVFRCIVNDGACADTTAEATLTIIDDAGINLISEALIGVYPNPVQDILNVKGITSKEFEYEVLSIDGKLLQKGKSQGEISVKDLRKGNYVLRIGQEQVSFVKQ
jgi:hypothetical protein